MTFIGKHHTEEHKAKMRGNGNPFFGKHHSDATKARLSNATRNRLLGKTGKNNYNWKGDEAGIMAGRRRAQKLFDCPEGMERHHMDGNPLNNAPENIMFVTRKEHFLLDGRLEKLHSSNRKTERGMLDA